MQQIIVDFEMNQITKKIPEREVCKMEIIEIGAVMLDENYEEVSSFKTYVKPFFNDKIIPSVTRLTGIKDSTVCSAPYFEEAIGCFFEWCLSMGDEVSIYAWSDSDYNQIKSELQLKACKLNMEQLGLVENPWIDFQHEFDLKLGFEKPVSLKNALEYSGITFSGKQHDALDDARNTAELFRVFKDEAQYQLFLGKIAEFMSTKSMGNTLGNILDFSGCVFV